MPINPAMDANRHQFGKYTLVERLGRGGMAEVWKAKILGPAGFSRTLVIKRILPHLVEDEQFKQMFAAEARLSARLNHANIVQVFELGDVDGEFYLAMEYVRGRDLVNVVRAQLLKGVPPPGLGAFVVREVCRALGYAHALVDDHGQPLRLIHRDVSPSNVMISFDGAVKLLDFGIAKALAEANENRTVTGTLKGKFGYMAPEQVEGKPIDHRADLFAAGVVLHEMLTGKRLFKGGSDLQTIAMVREAKVEPPSLLNPEVPPELDEICLKALARKPEDRFANCDLMAAALDDVVHRLKWGPERLSGVLRDLFPDEPSNSAVVPNATLLAQATVRQSQVTVHKLRWYVWKRRLAVAAATLAVAGVAAWLVATRHPAAPAVPVAPVAAAPLPRPSPSGAPAVAVAPPRPTSVTVRVATTPPGAAVYLDDARVPAGRTPVALMLPRSDDSAHLTIKLKGYETQQADVTPDSDSRLMLTMVRLPPAPRPAVAHAKKPKRPASTSKAPLPDLHRGDVVDPFAR